MKRYLWTGGLILAVSLAAGTAVVTAQRPPGPGPGPGGPSPIVAALDTDRDGVISAEEIKNASAALLTLDKNKDGVLSEDEYRPPRPPRPNDPNGSPPRPDDGNGPPPPPRPNRGELEGRNADRPSRPDGGGALKGSSGKTVPRGTLIFSNGYATDPRDHGRPVSLIAGELGVTDDVFRDAFSRVKPAHAGTQPDPEQIRKNKSVLMEALGKYDISNDRLDAVSNFYRYVQSRGERWPTTPASGYAKIEDGKVTGFVITNGGSGYSSPPTIQIEGMPEVRVQAKLAFGKDFKTNGSVSEVTLIPSFKD